MDGIVRTTIGLPTPDDPPSNPFDRPSLAYLVYHPISPGQLRQEIRDATGIKGIEVGTQGTSEPGTSFLFVSPPNMDQVDQAVVDALVDAHVPDPRWGRDPLPEDLVAAVAKLTSGGTLDLAEISLVLRYLVT
jgi:hypothetical protein